MLAYLFWHRPYATTTVKQYEEVAGFADRELWMCGAFHSALMSAELPRKVLADATYNSQNARALPMKASNAVPQQRE